MSDGDAASVGASDVHSLATAACADDIPRPYLTPFVADNITDACPITTTVNPLISSQARAAAWALPHGGAACMGLLLAWGSCLLGRCCLGACVTETRNNAVCAALPLLRAPWGCPSPEVTLHSAQSEGST